ncbi:MAG: DUF177 domain-containing protein [Rhodospirillales bacterium]
MPETPEFSRPFSLARLGAGRETQSLSASDAECAAVAERLGLVSLRSLSAEVTVTANPTAGVVDVGGALQARFTRLCVVTLKPFEQTLQEPLAQRYSLDSASGDVPVEIHPDAPDPLPDEGLDLGEEVVQHLSLVLDPYPRAPGAELPDSASDESANPFADLAVLRKGTKTPK